MKARILDRADVLKIVDLLQQQGYEVVAPFCGRGRDTYFDVVTERTAIRFRRILRIPTIRPSATFCRTSTLAQSHAQQWKYSN